MSSVDSSLYTVEEQIQWNIVKQRDDQINLNQKVLSKQNIPVIAVTSLFKGWLTSSENFHLSFRFPDLEKSQRRRRNPRSVYFPKAVRWEEFFPLPFTERGACKFWKCQKFWEVWLLKSNPSPCSFHYLETWCYLNKCENVTSDGFPLSLLSV